MEFIQRANDDDTAYIAGMEIRDGVTINPGRRVTYMELRQQRLEDHLNRIEEKLDAILTIVAAQPPAE